MKTPKAPPNEARRLARLKSLGILDTRSSEELDELVELAAEICGTPIALVSLVDEDRQWFKARIGLDATETPRDISFCGHAVESGRELFVVDADLDERFADNPLVLGGPQVKSYFGVPLTTDEGETLGTLCAIDRQPKTLEPSQLKQLRLVAAQALRCILRTDRLHSREKFFMMALDLFCIADVDGRIEQFNPRWTSALGYAAEEVQGASMLDFVHDDDREVMVARLADVRAAEEAKSFPARCRHKDGRHRWLQWTAVLDPQREQIYAVARDVTREKRAEQMKNEFVSTVSHELRTPLTSLRGGLGLVLGGAAGELPERAKQLLELAHRNGERLVALINDILDMEKIAAGGIRFENKDFDLDALCAEAVEANAPFGIERRVTVRLKADAVGIGVRGDPHRIRQVLDNLISNAIKFSREDGEVVVAASHTEQRAVVAVVDSGIGIADEFRDHVFEPFSQADASPTRQAGGTGLGLSIARAIAQRHGGNLRFDSKVGEGSTFYLELPIPPSSAPEQEMGADVLICEDDDDVALLIKLLLEREGIRAETVSTIAEARARIDARSYRAVTVDLALPDGNGIEIIQNLRRTTDTADVPVVVVSANADLEGQRLNGRSVEIVDWIAKPIDEARFRRAVRRAIARDTARILHVEDDPDIATLVRELVSPFAETVGTARIDEARTLLAGQNFDLIILDIDLGGDSGLDLIDDLNRGSTPVLVFAAQEPSAIDAARVDRTLVKGASDGSALVSTIKELLERSPSGAEPVTE